MTPIELHHKGFQALVAALGYADAIRFIKQLDAGTGNYTKERRQWLDALSLDDVWRELKRYQTPGDQEGQKWDFN